MAASTQPLHLELDLELLEISSCASAGVFHAGVWVIGSVSVFTDALINGSCCQQIYMRRELNQQR